MSNPKEKMNYYEILEVDPTAPQHEIHKAYLRAKSTYSQDNPALYGMFSREEARDLLKVIEEAYIILNQPQSRRGYDENLMRIATEHMAKGPIFRTTSQAPSDLSSMPDFAPTSTATPPPNITDDISQEFEVKRKDRRSGDALGDGMAKTPLSTYRLDTRIEQEIAAEQEFEGTFIQKVRTYKQVSVDALCDSTRIGRSYLVAIESNSYNALPAAVFVRGFIIQIARALGLDANKVANGYIKKLKDSGGR